MTGGERHVISAVDARERCCGRSLSHGAAAVPPFRSADFAHPPRAAASVVCAARGAHHRRHNTKSVLSRHPHPAWPNQPRVRRLEFVDGSADGTFHVDILVILAAKGEVRGRQNAIRQRHITDDKASRIVFDNSTDTACRPRFPCTS